MLRAVEADETYVGSKVRRPRHARPKTKQDDIVLGMVERGGGRLKLVPVADTKAAILQPLLEKHISEQVGTIYTDGHPIYVFAVKGKWPGKHQTIDHNRTYGIGDTHTNTIENAFSLFKRGLYGTFHRVSTKHLGRYCDEFSYRFNRRNEQPQLFAETTKALLDGKALTYDKLTASEVSES
jgi:ISXO2-like transposase domain